MTRVRSLVFSAALAVTTLGATPRAAAAQTPADTAAVLATVQGLFDAMLAHDSVALARVVTRDGVFAVAVVDGDSIRRFTHQPLAGFIASIGQPGPDLLERIWHPHVMIEGPFAAVWTAYDFHIGDRFNHCGIDVFTLARIGDAWRITGGSYTVQQQGCAPSPLGTP